MTHSVEERLDRMNSVAPHPNSAKPRKNVVAIMRSEEAAAPLQQAAMNIEDASIEVHIGRIENIESIPAAMNGHDILMVDIELGNQSETEHLRRFIAAHHQSRSIIVTAADFTQEEISRVMALGAVDVLSQPIRGLDLAVALDHAAREIRHIASQTSRGKVISFLKGGGGVGATTVAVQMAGILSVVPKKQPKRSVCILDLDIQFGAAGHYLDLVTDKNITELIDCPERLDTALLESVMANHTSGIKVLQSPQDVLPLEIISNDFVTKLLNVSRESHDYVLVDFPAAWTGWSYEVLRQSDLIVLVCQETVGSVRQTLRQLETLREQGLMDKPIRVVLNRYSGGSIWGKSREIRDAEKVLDHRFDFLLANDYQLVRNAENRGVLLSKAKRKSRLEKNIRKLTDDIVETLSKTEQSLNAAATS